MHPRIPNIEKRSYSLAELAQRHGLSERTLYNHIYAGTLRVTKVGRRSIVTVEAEQAWLAAMPTSSGRRAA